MPQGYLTKFEYELWEISQTFRKYKTKRIINQSLPLIESSSNPGEGEISAHCQVPSLIYTRARSGTLELVQLPKPTGVTS